MKREEGSAVSAVLKLASPRREKERIPGLGPERARPTRCPGLEVGPIVVLVLRPTRQMPGIPEASAFRGVAISSGILCTGSQTLDLLD